MQTQIGKLNQTKLTLLKIVGATFLMIFFAATALATTWAPIYPYVQKTENGKVKSHSIPYGVHDGGYGPGETFVYANGTLLYSIDKYFFTPFFTINNGQYLIEFDFYLYFSTPHRRRDRNGKLTIDPIVYNGKAINIYKDGQLFKTLTFRELKIDSNKTVLNKDGNWFGWNFNPSHTTKDILKIKMYNHPAFIENDRLYLISADNQIIEIEVSTGQIIGRQNAYETLKQKINWTPTTFRRKYKKVKYPEKFLLPKLKNGRTIEEGLARLFNKRISAGDRDSAVIKIYFHTLLINKEGKCEFVYVSPSIRTDLKKDFMYYEDDLNLKLEIENWIKQQTFKTNTFPRGFQKFKYSDFVYLR